MTPRAGSNVLVSLCSKALPLLTGKRPSDGYFRAVGQLADRVLAGALVTRRHFLKGAAILGVVAVAVAYSLDGGRFVSASWQASADGSGLELSGDRAVAFLGELYGKAELRLALVRPLSVPFLFTFAVGGAEQALGTMADRCHWSAAPAISEARP